MADALKVFFNPGSGLGAILQQSEEMGVIEVVLSDYVGKRNEDVSAWLNSEELTGYFKPHELPQLSAGMWEDVNTQLIGINNIVSRKTVWVLIDRDTEDYVFYPKLPPAP